MIAFLATPSSLSRCFLLQVHSQRFVVVTHEQIVEGERCKVTLAGAETVEMTALVEMAMVRDGVWLARIVAWDVDDDAPLRLVARERTVH